VFRVGRLHAILALTALQEPRFVHLVLLVPVVRKGLLNLQCAPMVRSQALPPRLVTAAHLAFLAQVVFRRHVTLGPLQ
jgi:hypothetical protein